MIRRRKRRKTRGRKGYDAGKVNVGEPEECVAGEEEEADSVGDGWDGCRAEAGKPEENMSVEDED